MYRLLPLLCLLNSMALSGQSVQLQQATKTVNKTFSYHAGYNVNVEGEKAEILVSTHTDSDIRVRLELIASHPDSTIARQGLERWEYLMTRHRNQIYLRNYLSEIAPDAEPVQLSARYTILLPESCPVYVKNQYGRTEITQLHAPVRVSSRFTDVYLENIIGDIDLISRYGALTGRKLNGAFTLDAQRSDVSLYEVSGSYDLKLQFGSLLFAEVISLESLQIDADRSDIRLELGDAARYAQTITVDRSEFELPPGLSFLTLEEAPGGRTIQYLPPSESYPGITIKVSLGRLKMD